MDDTRDPESAIYDLAERTEWRFELEENEAVAVRVSSKACCGFIPSGGFSLQAGVEADGHVWRSKRVLSPDPVFINSQEIPPNTWYPLYGDLKAAIWSPLPGGRIEETLAQRDDNDGMDMDAESGPRLMVLGPANAGKSTMIKNLVNLALGSGMGWAPAVVSLDPSNIVASMQDAWEQRREKDDICRSSGLFIDTPSSMTLPALGATKGSTVRYGLVREAAEAFDVDVLIVIGNEKLTIEMQKLFTKNGVMVISAPKSGGVVELDEHYRNRIKSQQTKTYFYGEPPLPPRLTNLPGRMVAMEASLHPHSFTVSWDDLEIYRIGEETAAPSSALPMGSTRVLSATRLTRVDPSAPANVHRLHNAVLGLVIVSEGDKREDLPPKKGRSGEAVKQEDSAAATIDGHGDTSSVKQEGEADVKTEENAEGDNEEEDEDEDEEPIWKEDIGWREVCGFLTITKIDTAKRKYELLTPSPGRLPSRVAIAGNVEWIEES
ncbi:hypothetical protein QFC19_008274 [Naganishia cerealis]|uniref:Uncharacterized protein n=1 Tax=Naganishia cerealis TaxID=610337 RepID=A0ACC2V2Y1_9TREE|nr:hypothetical protein QFC19_008274 [Naganishia cerealis]